jgi:hypothetical protein
MLGVLILTGVVIKISFNLGIPKVTLPAPCPAKWKVFRVIYVEGSPIDYPAIVPTFSPG